MPTRIRPLPTWLRCHYRLLVVVGLQLHRGLRPRAGLRRWTHRRRSWRRCRRYRKRRCRRCSGPQVRFGDLALLRKFGDQARHLLLARLELFGGPRVVTGDLLLVCPELPAPLLEVCDILCHRLQHLRQLGRARGRRRSVLRGGRRGQLNGRRTRLRGLIKNGEDHILLIDVGPADKIEVVMGSLGKSFSKVERQPVVI